MRWTIFLTVARAAIAPAAASADVTVYSGSDGFVHIIEDGTTNGLHFTDAVHFQDGDTLWDFGTMIWNTSGKVNMRGGANSGCIPYEPGYTPTYPTVICGSSAQSNAVKVVGGSGGGSIVYDVNGFLSGSINLRSILIGGGTGAKTIDLSLLNYDATHGATVLGGGGNQQITTGSGSVTIHGGSGHDKINFGSGDDNKIFADNGSQYINGTSGGGVVHITGAEVTTRSSPTPATTLRP